MRYLAIALMLISSIAMADNACLDLQNGLLVLTDSPCDSGDGMRKAIATHDGEKFYGCWVGEVVEEGSSISVFFPDEPRVSYNFNPAIFKTCQ